MIYPCEPSDPWLPSIRDFLFDERGGGPMRIVMGVMLLVAGVGAGATVTGQEKTGDAPMAKDSAWTWGYFFAESDSAKVKALFGERKHVVTIYRVDRVAAVQG